MAFAQTNVLLALCLFGAGAALAERSLLQTAASPFDWGRPCTLFGTPSQALTTGPGNAACTSCGSGDTATPEPTCTFKPITVPAGQEVAIYYHSSVHHLYTGDAACTYTTEICKSAPNSTYSKATPCTYKFTAPGSYYISDKAGKGGVDNGEYCKDFGASLPVTVTTAA